MACVHLWQDCANCVTLAVYPQRYSLECVKCNIMRTAWDAEERRRLLLEGVENNRGNVNGIELVLNLVNEAEDVKVTVY